MLGSWSISARAAALLAGGLVMAATSPAAQAQGTFGGFGRNAVNGIELKAEGVVLYSNLTFLSPASLCGQLYSNQPLPIVNKTARKLLEEKVFETVGLASSKLPKGFTLVRTRFDLSPGCKAEASYQSGQIFLNLALPRSIVFTSVTTPTIFGQGADPKFSVDFDANASAQLTIPTTPQQGLSLGPMRARVFNVKPDGQNFTGDIAIAIAKLVDEIGKLSLAAKLAQGMDVYKNRGIDVELGKVSALLKQRAPNARVQHDYDTGRDIVVINLVSGLVGPQGAGGAQQNVDRPGSDYTKFAATTDGECGAACGRNTMCLAWTWVKPGVQGPNAQCYLKRAVPNAVASNCCTSGVKARGCPSGLKGPNCDELDVR